MKFTFRPLATVVALVLFTAGCSTPYLPESRSSGFKEQQLSPNVYTVEFRGNGRTGEEQVVNYWLYRCAELTIKNGYTYFGMLPERRSSNFNYFDEPEQMASWRDGAPGMRKVGGFVFIPSYSTYTVRSWHNDLAPV